MKFDWKKTLATVAPAIATALGGPLAGMAVNVAASALGVEADEQAIAEAVATGNPEVLVRLREADNQFKLEMKRIGVDLKRIAAQDRASARNMARATSLGPQILLSVVFISGFVAVLYAVFSSGVTVDERMLNVAMFLLGILSAGITQIMNFFFGSSEGSRTKTLLLGAQK